MNALELKERIDSLCTHVLFDYNGQECGVDPFSHNEYDMRYGKKSVTVNSIDDVMNLPFFDGKALKDILSEVENLEG